MTTTPAAVMMAIDARSYCHVETMLKHGLDRLPLEPTEFSAPRPDHANVRGAALPTGAAVC
jgi:hypothetical protein